MNLDDYEVIERVVKKAGSSGAVHINKDFIGIPVYILINKDKFNEIAINKLKG